MNASKRTAIAAKETLREVRKALTRNPPFGTIMELLQTLLVAAGSTGYEDVHRLAWKILLGVHSRGGHLVLDFLRLCNEDERRTFVLIFRSRIGELVCKSERRPGFVQKMLDGEEFGPELQRLCILAGWRAFENSLDRLYLKASMLTQLQLAEPGGEDPRRAMTSTFSIAAMILELMVDVVVEDGLLLDEDREALVVEGLREECLWTRVVHTLISMATPRRYAAVAHSLDRIVTAYNKDSWRWGNFFLGARMAYRGRTVLLRFGNWRWPFGWGDSRKTQPT